MTLSSVAETGQVRSEPTSGEVSEDDSSSSDSSNSSDDEEDQVYLPSNYISEFLFIIDIFFSSICTCDHGLIRIIVNQKRYVCAI